LPDHHRDPFDRMLIAQSQIEKLPIVTGDGLIARYDVTVIW
jgi:PIN domain nuclease of toxin-antitoxin system